MSIMIREYKTLFTYDELNEEGRNFVVNTIIDAWLSNPDLVPDDARHKFDAAITYSEKRMRTPWFDAGYVWDFCQPWVEEEARRYYYTRGGIPEGLVDDVDTMDVVQDEVPVVDDKVQPRLF